MHVVAEMQGGWLLMVAIGSSSPGILERESEQQEDKEKPFRGSNQSIAMAYQTTRDLRAIKTARLNLPTVRPFLRKKGGVSYAACLKSGNR